MDTYDSFEYPFQYSDTDRYIRAVRFNLIRRNGQIKISAFKSNRGGVSVTRTNTTVYEKAMAYMWSHFEGEMVSFDVNVCKENDIYEKHSPSPGHNHHHWELYGDSEHNPLNEKQIAAILEVCRIEKSQQSDFLD